MNTNDIKEIEAFLKPGSGWQIIGIIFIIFGLIYMIPLPFLCPVFLAVGIFCFWRYFADRKKFRNRMTQQRDIVDDFIHGKELLEGNVRVGVNYIFGKGQKKEVAYSELRQVFQRVIRTYFIETNRIIVYKDMEGKEKTLCNVPRKGMGDQEVANIFAYISNRNPDVKLGYK